MNKQSIIKHLTILTFHESNGPLKSRCFYFLNIYPLPSFVIAQFFANQLYQSSSTIVFFLNSFDKTNS